MIFVCVRKVGKFRKKSSLGQNRWVKMAFYPLPIQITIYVSKKRFKRFYTLKIHFSRLLTCQARFVSALVVLLFYPFDPLQEK
ncbi:hypothetical protein HanPI659440_Chr01g0027431 [Helianthus annuus]|nr:hypothetical protein HanPI659440_Chr01g0027431 [Helianthus annuus]